MIRVEEAIERILSHVHPLGLEKVSILEALGRVIAEDAVAPRDLPPYDNSGMDGYAVRSVDVQKASEQNPVSLIIIEDLRAGFFAKNALQEGQAIRIMTGAPVPAGADAVVPVEETRSDGRSVSIRKSVRPGDFIRRAGEDVKQGDRVITHGEVIRPSEVGMLASIGKPFVLVYRRPVVAILCTGEELVDVGEPLEGAKIVSSNSYTLAAQVKECGAVPMQLGIARDDKEEIKRKLLQGLQADVFISSAGVSVGDYDFVREALKELGAQLIFWRVAMKPGKPVAFWQYDGKPVFSLPGNPVSSMVTFEQFVRPALLKMMGHGQLFRPVIEAILAEEIRKEPGKRHFIRGVVSYGPEGYSVKTTGPQGSGILRSMVRANGLIILPEDREGVKEGERVKVQLLYPPEFVGSGPLK
ncbi:MAG: molybdopterin molybdotransferase MoeA [Desulfobacterota bacterium]|nr:molybdopterin molybdotransferase MoeA [Thermodesulfobacteriota bacterium]